MSKKKLTIEQIWKAIEQGKTVIWCHEGYEVHPVSYDDDDFKTRFSYKNGYALRVTYISNWFGSLIDKRELGKCKILNRKPQIGWSEKDT